MDSETRPRTDGYRFDPDNPGQSHFPMGSTVGLGDPGLLRERREAIVELGEALRTLVDRSVSTEAPPAQLRRAAELIRRATAPLAEWTRQRAELPSADDLLGGVRLYNPVTGAGSPLAPPLRIDVVDGQVVGACTLGLAFEGPPMYAHGGVSAMLLDQILGYAVSASGNPGMTVRLDTCYHEPVPLQTPLRLTAVVTEVDGRRITARGTIAAESAPDEALATAIGTFVALLPEQAGRLFGMMRHADAANPAAAHD